MQKLLLAAAATAALGLGAGNAFAQSAGPVGPSSDPYAVGPTVQAQNTPPSQWTAPQTDNTGTTGLSSGDRLWKNGMPWSPSNPDNYDIPGG